jgi:hypothetical protein
VDKATQESAEGPVRGPSTAETARDASVRRDLDRVLCATHLIHDMPYPHAQETALYRLKRVL